MQCSYCDIAYALSDPNCRGCGAPKTADGVRRDLDNESARGRAALTIRTENDNDNNLLSYLDQLERLSSVAIVGIVVTILGLVWVLGPSGLIMMAIFLPKALSAKAEYSKAMQEQNDRQRHRTG